jgi:hypothetical protein
MRAEREMTRAKSRDVFGVMMAAHKDPSSQLQPPAPGDLARSRAVKLAKSKDTTRGRGVANNKRTSMTSALVFTLTSALSHPYQHLSQQRTKDFAKEPLSVRGHKNSLGEGTKLFCDACGGELSLVKSSIEDHCKRTKHKNNVAMMAHTKKDVVRIEESMNAMHKEVALPCSFGLDLTHLSRYPLRVSLFLATHKRFEFKPLLH